MAKVERKYLPIKIFLIFVGFLCAWIGVLYGAVTLQHLSNRTFETSFDALFLFSYTLLAFVPLIALVYKWRTNRKRDYLVVGIVEVLILVFFWLSFLEMLPD